MSVLLRLKDALHYGCLDSSLPLAGRFSRGLQARKVRDVARLSSRGRARSGRFLRWSSRADRSSTRSTSLRVPFEINIEPVRKIPLSEAFQLDQSFLQWLPHRLKWCTLLVRLDTFNIALTIVHQALHILSPNENSICIEFTIGDFRDRPLTIPPTVGAALEKSATVIQASGRVAKLRQSIPQEDLEPFLRFTMALSIDRFESFFVLKDSVSLLMCGLPH